MTYGDPRFRRMERPGAQRHGRQVGRRDKLIAVAFGALLIFGLWRILLFPTDYTVSTLDIDGVIFPTKTVLSATHWEYYAHYGQSDVIVLISFDGKIKVAQEKSLILHAQMLLEGKYPDAARKKFANAFVICGVPDDCSSLADKIKANAKDR
jgi:hypothetical protein